MALIDDKYKKSKTSRPSLGEIKIIKSPEVAQKSSYSTSNEITSLNNLQTIKSVVDNNSVESVSVKGFKIPADESTHRAFSIAEKDGLGGLLFSHYDISTQTDATISLAWSYDAPSSLTIQGADGIINTSSTGVSGGTIYRVLTTTIPHGSAFSLPEDIIKNFKNLSKKIHFYVSSSISGVEMTIFKTNE